MNQIVLILLSIVLFVCQACSQTNSQAVDNPNDTLKTSTVVHQNTNTAKITSSLNLFIDSLLTTSNLQHGRLGFCMVDLSNDSLICQHEMNRAFIPASIQKIVTTAAALDILGKDFRFETVLERRGKIDAQGVLQGDVYIRGIGDPCLGSKRFGQHYQQPYFLDDWALALKKAGINKISGTVVGDASLWDTEAVPPTWVWEDVSNHYGAGASALSVFDNFYYLHFRSGAKDGDPTTIIGFEPQIPNLTFVNKVRSSNENRDNAYIFGAPDDTHKTIRGTIPKNRKQFTIKGAIPEPDYVVAELARKRFQQQGILVNKPATTVGRREKQPTDSATFLFRTLSPKLADIVVQTNQKSINLYAEHMLKFIGSKTQNVREYPAAIEALKEYWKSKDINTDGLFMYDACGLSRYNGLTPKLMTDILNYMYNKCPDKAIFLKSLPVAGQSGTLRYFCKGTIAEGKIRAKSGSMRQVRSYAGYVDGLSGKKYAFCFILNNFNCSLSEARKVMEKLMTEVVRKY